MLKILMRALVEGAAAGIVTGMVNERNGRKHEMARRERLTPKQEMELRKMCTQFTIL